MTGQELTNYDEVYYPGYAYPGTHPDHLASVAYLFGLNPTLADRCRVLEIGCGDGANLIPMAYSYPHSRFVGIDLAELAINRGLSVVEELALQNISLIRMNLRDLGEALGRFDYIIAHGVYSWIPGELQDRLLEVCRENLSPEGVVFISYNIYPGSHIRQMIREILRFHVQSAPDPATRVSQARALSALLEDALCSNDARGLLMKEEWHRILQRAPGALYHDELAEISLPVYFHEFVERAATHGLQYLADSELFTMFDCGMSDQARQAMSELEDQRILREQYLDFVRIRRFRQTLLCHQEIAVRGKPLRERLQHLRFSSRAKVEASNADLGEEKEGKFRGPGGGLLISVHPAMKELMLALISRWPCSIPFSELLSLIDSHLGDPPAKDPVSLMEEVLSAALETGVLELGMCETRVTRDPGEKPSVSRVARFQATEGEVMTNMRHMPVRVPDDAERKMIQLMDGTRDRWTLAQEYSRLSGREADLDAFLRELGSSALLLSSD